MRKWCGLAGLAAWLGGTLAVAVLMSRGVIAEPVDLRLPDGTPIHGTLYHPANGRADLAPVVVVHGTALSHRSCAPGLSIPLAREDCLTLAIDLRGHGHSGGSLSRGEMDAAGDGAPGTADYPEIDAAIDFLKRHPLTIKPHPSAPTHRLALVGHSRGGLAAASVGFRRPDVDGVVSLGAAPRTCDPQRPRNLLILRGGADRLFLRDDYVAAIGRATGGAVREPYRLWGNFRAGTARHLQLVGGTNHLTELADRSTTHHVVQWVTSAVRFHFEPPPRAWLPGLVAAVLAASLGGVAACAWLLAGAAGACLGAPPATGARPVSRLRAALALALLPLAVPAVAAASGALDVGPVYLAMPAVVLVAAAAGCCVTASAAGSTAARRPPHLRTAGRGLAVGIVALALVAPWLGLPWGRTWLDLLPSGRRALVALVLLPALLPLCLALASSVGRLAGGARWLTASAWLSVPAALWCGQVFFGAALRPLFAIPVLCVAASFIVPLPLWLLRDRPGMTPARAICHAGGLSWLLACHLPFVHGG